MITEWKMTIDVYSCAQAYKQDNFELSRMK